MVHGFKLRVFQPIVPEYRVALFNGVGRRYGANAEIWASEGKGQDKSYALESMRYDYGHPFKNLGVIRWQKGLSVKGLSRGDVIVICGDVHQLSSLWIAFLARFRGVGVVWWGHHLSVGSNEFSVRIRLFFTKWLSDVVLCYTNCGTEWFRARGWHSPVFATGNTIDLESVRTAMAAWPSNKLMAFQKEYGIFGRDVVIFCSVLRWKTHLEQLLEAMASNELSARRTILVVIGEGEGRSLWEQRAKELGVAERVIWAGAIRKQMLLAPWFLSAKVYAYPGPIGLSIIHAFAYGLPAVCHHNSRHHGPEFEAMKDGLTGYVFKEGNVGDLSSQIERLFTNEPKRKEISAYVKNLAFDRYGIDSMVDNFCAAIEEAHRKGCN